MANRYRAKSKDGKVIEGTAVEIADLLFITALDVYKAHNAGSLLLKKWKLELIGKSLYTRKCVFCGKEFESIYAYTKYCSRACNNKANKAERKAAKNNIVKMQSAGEIDRLARAAGLSYGMYVAKMGL